jgi:hypothetical protein
VHWPNEGHMTGQFHSWVNVLCSSVNGGAKVYSKLVAALRAYRTNRLPPVSASTCLRYATDKENCPDFLQVIHICFINVITRNE